MKQTSRIMFAAAVAGAGFLAMPAAQAAEKFPTRPIAFVVPYPPGGPVDMHLRPLATAAQRVFGVPVVIENKPGGAATLGPATVAATAKPDGYTLVNLQTSIFSVPVMQKVSFDPLKDFTYIIQLAGFRLMMVVRTDSPWKTWKELVAGAKAAPNTISFGSSGPGGPTHLGIASIAQAAGIQLLHVPFRGGAEFLAAVVGDHVKLAAPAPGAARSHIEVGTLRPLLSLTRTRSAMFPNVPAVADENIVTDIDLSLPHGIGGPKGMDPALVKFLHDGFKTAAESPEHVQALEQVDMSANYLSTADYAAFAVKSAAAYRKLVVSLGMARAD